MFDNAPSHRKLPADGLSARNMPKGPKNGWTPHKDGPKMRSTSFVVFHPPLLEPWTTDQDLYFDDNHPTMPGWFKGMELILQE